MSGVVRGEGLSAEAVMVSFISCEGENLVPLGLLVQFRGGLDRFWRFEASFGA